MPSPTLFPDLNCKYFSHMPTTKSTKIPPPPLVLKQWFCFRPAAVSHLAVDWVANNWYFADEAREVVYVCDASLQFCRMLLDAGLGKLRGLALDPAAG